MCPVLQLKREERSSFAPSHKLQQSCNRAATELLGLRRWAHLLHLTLKSLLLRYVPDGRLHFHQIRHQLNPEFSPNSSTIKPRSSVAALLQLCCSFSPNPSSIKPRTERLRPCVLRSSWNRCQTHFLFWARLHYACQSLLVVCSVRLELIRHNFNLDFQIEEDSGNIARAHTHTHTNTHTHTHTKGDTKMILLAEYKKAKPWKKCQIKNFNYHTFFFPPFYKKKKIYFYSSQKKHGVNAREPEGALGHCHKHNVRVSYCSLFAMYI